MEILGLSLGMVGIIVIAITAGLIVVDYMKYKSNGRERTMIHYNGSRTHKIFLITMLAIDIVTVVSVPFTPIVPLIVCVLLIIFNLSVRYCRIFHTEWMSELCGTEGYFIAKNWTYMISAIIVMFSIGISLLIAGL